MCDLNDDFDCSIDEVASAFITTSSNTYDEDELERELAEVGSPFVSILGIFV
jgi:hypothetical protein